MTITKMRAALAPERAAAVTARAAADQRPLEDRAAATEHQQVAVAKVAVAAEAQASVEEAAKGWAHRASQARAGAREKTDVRADR